MTTFINRVTGAALLNAAIYEEVESDRSATMQAMGVVALSSLAAGVGALGPAGARFTNLAGISLLAFAVAVWMLMAMIVAVRQALDYTSTARAFAVCALGWVLAFGMAIGVGILFSPPLH
jgi:hypothetical protein